MIAKGFHIKLAYLIIFIFLYSCKKEDSCTENDSNAPIENWTKSSTGITQGLNDLHFYNNLGLVSGNFGTILKTTDEGNTWTALPSPGNYTFRQSLALSESDLIVGSTGLYKSNNSGLSFFEIGNTSNLGGGSMKGIYFSDTLSGIISKGGSIYRTSDGGLNWENTYLQYGYASILNYTSDSTFFLLGGITYDGNSTAEVHKSTNNGKTWTQLNLPIELAQSQILASFFLSNSTGYVATLNNKLFETTDGGSTWIKLTDLNFNTTSSFATKKILFINSTTAYIIAGNSIYNSIDSGKNWSLDYRSGDNVILTDLESNVNNKLFVVDNGGNLYTKTFN